MKQLHVTALVILLTLISSEVFSQVTDNDIVNALIGKNYNEANPILNGLGVWYHFHLKESKAAKGYEGARGKFIQLPIAMEVLRFTF